MTPQSPFHYKRGASHWCTLLKAFCNHRHWSQHDRKNDSQLYITSLWSFFPHGCAMWIMWQHLWPVPGPERLTAAERCCFRSPAWSQRIACSHLLGGGVLQMPACTGWSMFSTDGVFEEFSWQTLKCLYWTSVNWEISKVYSLAKCGWIFKEMAKGTSPRAGPSLLQMLCFCSKAQSPQLNIVRNNIPIFFFNFIFRNGWIIFAKSFQNNRGLGKRSAEQISIWEVMFSKGKYCLTRAVPVLSIINYKAKF